MDKLKAFLKSLPDDDARQAFAERCQASLGHLRNVIYGPKLPGPALCVLIERHTDGAVTRQDLRADWADIWPELAAQANVAPVEAA